jgi:hypothetical protein
MDEMVLRGMAKWPNVPAVFGWLTLDRRGNWLINGEHITNPVIPAYIGRNYERDSEGRWFFQNGPQRVYVNLEYTPLVYRAIEGGEGPALQAHTGAPVTALARAYFDEDGALLLETEHGVGVVHDHDLERMLPAFVDENDAPLDESEFEKRMQVLQTGAETPLWLKLGPFHIKVEAIRAAEVPSRFGFANDPRPDDGSAAEAREH